VTALTLAEMAVEVLTTADGRAKTALSRAHAARWRESRAGGAPIALGHCSPPDRPARPVRPELLSPRDVPRRGPGTPEGRIALLHAVAHIELNAVDLHWDIIARFTDTQMPPGFCDDWVKAADEESKHFNLMCDCLEAHGSHYGALPAHDFMWRAAEDTAGDHMGRLAVVPMVLEAPTVSTQGALPGAPMAPYCGWPFAALPMLPAAATTTMPASTARLAASVSGSVL